MHSAFLPLFSSLPVGSQACFQPWELPCYLSSMIQVPVAPALGGRNRWVPRACWSTSLAKNTVSLWLSERPYLEAMGHDRRRYLVSQIILCIAHAPVIHTRHTEHSDRGFKNIYFYPLNYMYVGMCTWCRCLWRPVS